MVDTWNIYRVVLGVATGIAVFVLLGVRAGPVQEPSLLVFLFRGDCNQCDDTSGNIGVIFSIDDWYVWVFNRSCK
ncbi:MAG: hypothetical protein CM15mP49_21340 [Actinomycetota bacterium]|nr:MAG: hypothetical protein CM15mP49_21340 [Actinomycetota bacterium]